MFTVVIPLYNKESHISRAISSVLQQTFDQFELIIINDGSTDRSASIVVSHNDPRIKLITQENLGEAGARNRGINEAKYKYVAFLDADDAWQPKFLETIRKLIFEFPDKGGYGTKISDSVCFAEFENQACKEMSEFTEVYINDDYIYSMSKGNWLLSSSSTCIRTDILRLLGGFDEALKIGTDRDMWIRVSFQTEIVISSYIGAIYYTDAENMVTKSSDALSNELKYYLQLANKYLAKVSDKRVMEVHNWVWSKISATLRNISKSKPYLVVTCTIRYATQLGVRHTLLIFAKLLTPSIIISAKRKYFS